MIYTSVTNRNWKLKTFDLNQASKLTQDHSLDEIQSRLLAIRNIKTEEVKDFLKPTLKNLMPDPNIISDMEKAVERIYQTIIEKKTIGIFGDYDVDGASATALLTKYFTSIKVNSLFYIPDRKKDGYGPSIDSFEKLISLKSNIIITVDCGTVAFEAIKYSKNKNVDVIVLDHHQAEVHLPDACAVVNPNRLDDESGLNYLSAAGVTLMFLVSLNSFLRKKNWFNKNKIQEPDIINFLDLVSLGTVCDVVPLVKLNRALVSQGLKILKKRKNLGLKTLYDASNHEEVPTTYHLGYVFGPRINAGGRVGKSSHGAKLLTTDDPQTSYKLANELNLYNEERKLIEKELLNKVNDEVKKNIDDPVYVLSGVNWHEGVIGIIASRIKEKYNKPTFLISLNNNEKIGKGSARSIYGFDIGTTILAAVQSKILLKGGGHKMAGGFAIDRSKIKDFKKFLFSKFDKSGLSKRATKNIYADSIISISALNIDFFDKVDELAPFGSGNSEPKFIVEDVKIVNSQIVGEKHLKVILCDRNGKTVNAISFNAIGTSLEGYLNKKSHKMINIIGKMSSNNWKGKRNIEFIIDDISVNKSNNSTVPSSNG